MKPSIGHYRRQDIPILTPSFINSILAESKDYPGYMEWDTSAHKPFFERFIVRGEDVYVVDSWTITTVGDTHVYALHPIFNPQTKPTPCCSAPSVDSLTGTLIAGAGPTSTNTTHSGVASVVGPGK